MLDTIRIRGFWKLHRSVKPGRWIPMRIEATACADETGEYLRWVEVSLPRLLYGSNGRVLADQSAVDESLSELAKAIREVAKFKLEETLECARADLAWNFELCATQIVTAYTHVRHPLIREAPYHYDDSNGISWSIKRTKCGLKLYNKCLHMGLGGSVLRAEVLLRGQKLRDYLPGTSWRSFDAQYRVYRRFLTELPQVGGTLSVKKWQHAVGLEEPDVRNRILARLTPYTPSRTLRRWKVEIHSAAARLEKPFTWADVLPLDAPPAEITVTPKAKRALRRPGIAPVGHPSNNGGIVLNA